MNSSLAIFTQADKLLAEANTIQEAKELKSKFVVVAEWVKQMKMGEDAQRKVNAYILRATRKMGEMLKTTDRAKGADRGGRPKIDGSRAVPSNPPPTLSELRISKKESAEAQKLASVTVQKFEEAVEKNAKTAQEVLRIAAGCHVSQNSGDNEWYTPKEYIEAAREILGEIDLDPASSAEANSTVKAKAFFSEADNGLTKKWSGNVWMNPPYAGELIGPFAEKVTVEFATGNISAAIILVNNATETKWFQKMARKASALCFPSGRIRFWHPRKESATPLQGQAILYLGPNGKGFCARFSEFGLTCSIEY